VLRPRSLRWRVLACGRSSPVPAFRAFKQPSHPSTAAQSNSFRMRLLYKSQNNFYRDRRSGRILSRRTLLESARSGENRFQKPASNKCPRITFLYKRKNNCPGITLLQKKVGGGGLRAHFLGHSLNQENLSRSERNASNSLLCPAPAISLGRPSITSLGVELW
jgi:hypothetical protein